MIEDTLGPIDYDESGGGATFLFVPGSCSTGAAWRPVLKKLGGRYRAITTSLSGYGGTAERRTQGDQSIGPVATALETAIRQAKEPVHLIGHSFGGLVGLAVALRGVVPLASLTILEAPAPAMLAMSGEREHYAVFRAMTDAYTADFASGNAAAISTMIDFYGGAGTYAAWPDAVQAYARSTTATNVLDWISAYAFQPARSALAELALPLRVIVGANSHPAVVTANRLISDAVPRASFTTIAEASHFMIATHPDAVARLIAERTEKGSAPASGG